MLNKDFQIECPRIDNREVGSRVSSLLNTYDLSPLGAVWVGGRPLGDGKSGGETVTFTAGAIIKHNCSLGPKSRKNWFYIAIG